MFPLCGPVFPYPKSYARLVLRKVDCTAWAVIKSYPGCLHAIAHSTRSLYLSYFVGSYFEAYSLLGVLLSVSSFDLSGNVSVSSAGKRFSDLSGCDERAPWLPVLLRPVNCRHLEPLDSY